MKEIFQPLLFIIGAVLIASGAIAIWSWPIGLLVIGGVLMLAGMSLL